MSIGTFTNPVRQRVGTRWEVTATYTPAASSGASGDALTAAALKQLGLSSLDQMIMGPLVVTNGATSVPIAWERGTDGKGKIHIYEGVAPHAHSFLVKGGTAAAGTDALNIKTVIIGKEAATDATSLAADTATKGGVLATAAGATTLGRQTGGDFSTYKSPVIARGRGV